MLSRSGPLLAPLQIPSIFVTGTDTGVGKTFVAGALANWFRLRGFRVAVLKPVATGCVRRREGLVSEDAEFLAACADARFPLDLICPQRYEEPLAPSVAAERAGVPLDWSAIDRSIRLMSAESDVMIVEGVGGIMVPMDASNTVLDMAVWLRSPTVVVARPSLGTINHTLLTLGALESADVSVAGVIINRYQADGATVAEETSGRVIEKWGRKPVLATIPEGTVDRRELAADIVAALDPIDWNDISKSNR